MFSRLRSLGRGIAGRRRFEDGMADEMRFHIETCAADLERAGVPPAEALRRARLAFGGVDAVKEDCREARGLRIFDHLWQDLRYTFRLMRKTPGFTTAAVLSLGLGIGANTAIFSLIDAVMRRTLPVKNAHELYFLAYGESERPSTSSNYPLFERYRTAPVFSDVTAWRTMDLKVGSGEAIELVRGQFVSGNYHAVIGPAIVLGRGFVAEPDRGADGNAMAVISKPYWIRRFGRAPDVLGKQLTISGRNVSIVGVTAAEFTGPVPGMPIDITLPMSVYVLDHRDYLEAHDTFTGMPLVARLRPGVSEAQAAAVAEAVSRQFMSEPENRWARDQRPQDYAPARLLAAGKGGYALRNQYRDPLSVLMAMAGLVLLIASANVANLLLARSTARAKEVAVRLCVGGGRSRLIRQFLTESAVLALAGAVLGVLLAGWGTDLILGLFAIGEQPIQLDVSPNLRVFAFTAAIALATGIAFGLAPALKATSLDLTPALKESGPVQRAPRHAAQCLAGRSSSGRWPCASS